MLQNMREVEGESQADRWMRAYAMATQRTQTAPEQAAREFYTSTLTKLLPSSQYETPSQPEVARAEALAREMTMRFQEQYLSGASLPVAGDLSGSGGPAVEPAPTPTPRQSASGAVFQEGKVYRDANGNLARYVNGNFVPVNR